MTPNRYPTEAEIIHTHAEIDEHVLQLEQLDLQLTDLAARRAAVQNSLGAKRAFISIARRLPHDILQEIFVACLPTHENAAVALREAPLVLSRVCAGWRHVALMTPRLWASLHIPFAFFAATDRSHVLKEWFARSRACGLSLSIQGVGSSLRHPPAPEHVAKVLSAILAESARWEHLQLSRCDGEVSTAVLGQPAPMLRSLEFLSKGVGELGSMEIFRAPRLQRLFLPRMVIADADIASLPVCWENLTHFGVGRASKTMRVDRVDGLSFAGVHMLLRRCPRMRHLQFIPRGSVEFVQEGEALKVADVAALKTLVIFQCGPHEMLSSSVPAFWEALPNFVGLRTLDLSISAVSQGYPIHRVLDKMPQLESVDIPAPAEDILHLLPNVSRLKFTTGVTTAVCESLLRGLTPAEGIAPACPHLKSLFIPSSQPVDVRVVRAFVSGHLAAASTSSSAFRQLRIRFGAEQEQPVLFDEQLKEVRRLGRLEINISVQGAVRRATVEGTSGRHPFGWADS